MTCGKIGLLHSRSRSQQCFEMSVNVCPDDIFRTTENFVTELGVVMQHHKPECSVKYWITAIKVKVTEKVRMLMCAQMISPKPANIFFFKPNLVLWCIIMSQNVMRKVWFAIFKVRVTAKGQNVSVYPDDIFETIKHFVAKLGIVMHHYEPEWHARRLERQ